MEPKKLNDLHANPKNPRQMSKHDAEALERSVQRFGDLSSVVFNVRTNQLVGGHQRIQIMKRLMPDAQIEMLQPYPLERDAIGTVGIGFITINGSRFPYREVDWDSDFEAAANIAANRIQGDFNTDMLAQMDYELSQAENASDLLQLTGQTEDEVNRMLKHVGAIDDDEQTPDEDKPEKLEFALTRDQRLVVERTVEHVKSTVDLQAVESASLNGSALYVICQEYLQRHEPEINSSVPPEPTPAPAGLTETPDSAA